MIAFSFLISLSLGVVSGQDIDEKGEDRGDSLAPVPTSNNFQKATNPFVDGEKISGVSWTLTKDKTNYLVYNNGESVAVFSEAAHGWTTTNVPSLNDLGVEKLTEFGGKQGNWLVSGTKGFNIDQNKAYTLDPNKGLIESGAGATPGFWGTQAGQIVKTAGFALAIYGGVKMAADMFGAEEGLSNALARGALSGYLAGKIAAWQNWQFLGGPWVIGIGIGILVFILSYKKTETIEVTFDCMNWEAPKGGSDCEKCNNDPFKPCSEYRCRSLGQTCDLLNPGTEDEQCVDLNPRDTTSPIITPYEDALKEGYSYSNVKTRPPSPGLTLKYDESDDGCIQAYTPLSFGVMTDEPAQCKIDYNITKNYEDMKYYFGESNLYLYNHTQILALPGPDAVSKESPEIKHDGTFTLYVRCQDGNGNYNQDEFAIRFCVDPEPDNTAPVIERTSFASDTAYVSYNADSTPLSVFVNEPAECKWDQENQNYDDMDNIMICATSLSQVNPDLTYTCTTELTGIQKANNYFYIRCKDQPWLEATEEEGLRNTNKDSYELTIIRTQEELKIIEQSPEDETIRGSAAPVPVYLEVETDAGAQNGKASCYYSPEKDNVNTLFYETGERIHKQRLDLVAGSYEYYVKCQDLGANEANATIEFDVEVDEGVPRVVRVFKSGGKLELITNEDSSCYYSLTDCNFALDNGISMPIANSTTHTTDWKTDSTFYVKCIDEYGNQPSTCSIIVRPYDLE